MRIKDDYYVYVLFRETGVPFYIGKGKGPRWKHHEWDALKGRKGHRFSIIRKMLMAKQEIPKIKIHEGLTEAAAHEYEIALINALGRVPDGPLVNETNGGEGVSGLQFTPESRALMRQRALSKSPEVWARIKATKLANPPSPEMKVRMGAANVGRKASPETRAKMSTSRKGMRRSPEAIAKTTAANRGKMRSLETRAKLAAANLGKKASAEARAKISASLLGNKRANGRLGKKHSVETRAKMSAAARNRPAIPAETRAKMSAAKRGRKLSPETRAKMSAAAKRGDTPESRVRKSTSAKAAWAKRQRAVTPLQGELSL